MYNERVYISMHLLITEMLFYMVAQIDLDLEVTE